MTTSEYLSRAFMRVAKEAIDVLAQYEKDKTINATNNTVRYDDDNDDVDLLITL